MWITKRGDIDSLLAARRPRKPVIGALLSLEGTHAPRRGPGADHRRVRHGHDVLDRLSGCVGQVDDHAAVERPPDQLLPFLRQAVLASSLSGSRHVRVEDMHKADHAEAEVVQPVVRPGPLRARGSLERQQRPDHRLAAGARRGRLSMSPRFVIHISRPATR